MKHNFHTFWVLAILLLCSSSALKGQKIVSAEFFVDSDPGVGNGTLIPSFSSGNNLSLDFKIHQDSMSSGPHYLFIRVRDSIGKWSLYEGRPFYILDPASNVTSTPIESAEYFIDTDPGVGNANPIPSFTSGNDVALDIKMHQDSLDSGPHYLFIRVKDQNGKWSLYEGRPFYVLDKPLIIPNATLVSAEYFIDTDPGVGNGIALDSFVPGDSMLVDEWITRDTVTSLGMHYLHIRFKDSNGKWGHYERDSFEIVACHFPRLDFSFANDCLDEQTLINDFSLSVDSTASYIWDIGNNGTVTDTTYGSTSYIFTDTGTFEVKLIITNTNICKDSLMQSITIHPVDTTPLTDVEICDGDSSNIFGTYYFSSGFHSDTLSSEFFCDSILHRNLIVHPVFEDTNSLINKCLGNGDTIFGNYQNTTNIYIDSSLSEHGCDSVTIQELIIRPIYLDTLISTSICSNDSELVFGSYRDTAGHYYNNLSTNLFLCDSIEVKPLFVLPISEITINQAFVCQGDSIPVFGVNRGSTGFYYQTLSKTNGCDSIIEQELVVMPDYDDTLSTVGICPGDSFLIFNQYRDTAGLYYDSLLRTTGCDSVIYQQLIIHPTYQDTLTSLEVCHTDSVLIFGSYRDTAGIYINNSSTLYGCDSVNVQYLNVHPIYNQVLYDTICNDSIYYFLDNDSATVYTIDTSHLFTSKGCDSIWITHLYVDSASCPGNKVVNALYDDGAVKVHHIDLSPGLTCELYNVEFRLSGATNGAGYGDVSGRFFNVDTTTVVYTYNYRASNLEQKSCKFNVIVSEDYVGIEESGGDGIRIFPNPNNGSFTILFDVKDIGAYEIRILDNKGALILFESDVMGSERAINLEGVESGVYVLQIKNDENNIIKRFTIH